MQKILDIDAQVGIKSLKWLAKNKKTFGLEKNT